MKTVPLADVAEINPRSPVVAADEAVSFVGMAQLDAVAAKTTAGEDRKFSDVSKGYTVFADGDILVAKITPCFENNKIGQAQLDRKIGVGSTEFHVLRPDDQLHDRYLLHFLRQSSFRRRGEMRMTGSAGQRRVPAAFLQAVQIPLPPLDEQRRIAGILDRASALCQKPRTMLASLDALIQAQFVEMFDGEYEQKPVSDLCELLVDCVNRTAPTVDEETPYKMLRTTNVRHGRVNTTDVKFVSAETFARWNRRATPQRGDVILTREAPVGEAGILDSDDSVFLGQRLFLYRVDPKHLTPEFLRACFDSPLLRAQFDRLGSGSTVKHLPLPACQNFLIPSPPIEVQLRYSDFVRSVAKVAQSIRSASVKLDELFASLQSRAFSGQL